MAHFVWLRHSLESTIVEGDSLEEVKQRIAFGKIGEDQLVDWVQEDWRTVGVQELNHPLPDGYSNEPIAPDYHSDAFEVEVNAIVEPYLFTD